MVGNGESAGHSHATRKCLDPFPGLQIAEFPGAIMPRAPRRSRHTRIVATIGPRSRTPEMLRSLLDTGVDVARINCSHASHDIIRADVARIRRAAMETGRNVAILLDLQGPKIRTGKIPEPMLLEVGDCLTVVMDPDYPAQAQRCGTTWPSMASDVKAGELVLFADGALGGTVESVRVPDGQPAEVDIRITIGGRLGSHKGINLPETDIEAPALTEKDRADLAVGVSAGVDYVALSFVRHAQDCLELRGLLNELDAADMPIIAKIEKPEAVAGIDGILEHVQGIMVARGDLGVEIPYEQVPAAQKTLIQAANRAGALVITATQMLDSMERNPRPTRAEITDVANAILDGTDAVMLSGETSVGQYPLEAVTAMSRIASEVEASPWFQRPDINHLPHARTAEGTVLRAASYAVREGDRALVVFTWSGNTAVKASKGRPKRGVFAITHDQKVADRLSLAWGVNALVLQPIRGTDDLIAAGEKALLEAEWVTYGEEAVLLAGRVPMRGATNMMKIEVMDGRAVI